MAKLPINNLQNLKFKNKNNNDDLVWSTFEHVHITNSSHSINFVVVYRPPPSSDNGLKNSVFLNEFDNFIGDVSLLPGHLILLGDFNMHWDCPSKSDVIHFSSTTTAAGLTQHVHGPTHKHGYTLDLVFTRCNDTMLQDCHTEDKLMSDHRIICFTLDLPKPKPMRVTSTLRNYRKINHDEFAKSLTDFISSCPSDVEHDSNSTYMFDWYNTGMEKLLNSYAPPITRTRLIKTRMPWYNESIHLARRKRRQAECKWRKFRSADDHELYLTAKRNVTDLTITAKEAFFKDKISSCNSKDVYQIINSLLNRNVHHLPFYDSACTLSNKFATYFKTKVVNIRSELDAERISTNARFLDSSNTTVPHFLFSDQQLKTKY